MLTKEPTTLREADYESAAGQPIEASRFQKGRCYRRHSHNEKSSTENQTQTHPWTCSTLYEIPQASKQNYMMQSIKSLAN
jgi:hypothetical protein